MIKTTNKDLSCKVMEAGIEIDADMFHVTDQWKEQKLLHKDSIDYITDVVRVPAPTVCEWLEVIEYIDNNSIVAYLKTSGLSIRSVKDAIRSTRYICSDANRLASLAIWLVEQGLWVEKEIVTVGCIGMDIINGYKEANKKD